MKSQDKTIFGSKSMNRKVGRCLRKIGLGSACYMADLQSLCGPVIKVGTGSNRQTRIFNAHRRYIEKEAKKTAVASNDAARWDGLRVMTLDEVFQEIER